MKYFIYFILFVAAPYAMAWDWDPYLEPASPEELATLDLWMEEIEGEQRLRKVYSLDDTHNVELRSFTIPVARDAETLDIRAVTFGNTIVVRKDVDQPTIQVRGGVSRINVQGKNTDTASRDWEFAKMEKDFSTKMRLEGNPKHLLVVPYIGDMERFDLCDARGSVLNNSFQFAGACFIDMVITIPMDSKLRVYDNRGNLLPVRTAASNLESENRGQDSMID